MGRPRKGTPKRLFSVYKSNCKRRNIFWGLTLEEVGNITKKNCIYCDSPPKQAMRSYLYNGIDRKNNKRGYTLDNSVPCCGRCNSVKGANLTYEEMLEVGKILKKWGNRK